MTRLTNVGEVRFMDCYRVTHRTQPEDEETMRWGDRWCTLAVRDDLSV
ncbi:hypothetical protein CKA32_005924 [Geitlerinema sp. FC II]|nr:hypothetical protein CKA32_005924 [Geitlerinema sp. FC II]